jgi:two-component system sensor histidine kinase KdpD
VTGVPAYLGTAVLVALATVVAWGAHRALSLSDVVMVYLLAVIVTATLFGLGPSLVAAALSVVAYDFFFVPPAFTLQVQEARYLPTFAMMFAIGVVMSSLTSRLREQRGAALLRARRASAQYALSSALADAGETRAVADAASRFAAEAFGGSASFLVPGGDGLQLLASVGDPPSPAAWAWARTALATGRAAGGHDALLCLPLATGVEPVGVLVLAPWPEAPADPERGRFVEALGRQIAVALERVRLAEEARRTAVRAVAEEQRSALLSAVSHDLRTPLAAITGAATALRDDTELPAEQRGVLLGLVCDEAERLERLVSDLLDMTRLQGEHVRLRREWVPLDEIVGTALARMERPLRDRPVSIDVADATLAWVDPALMERLLVNLLENAAKYTPAGTEIAIRAGADHGAVRLEIADRGPGIPPGDEERVFERFYRGVHPGVGGAGLGLAIARAVAQAHGGAITVGPRQGGGAVFTLGLPLPGEPPPVPREEAP